MTPKEVLETLRVPTTCNWYMVGHGASRVTLRTQQVRALNLAWALLEASGARNQRVVVIGGGVAGLTASAALATCGATVTVLERHAQLVPLQRNCTKRHLHPHVFDWPDPISENTDAGLPILNWRADWAREVAIAIEDGFNGCEKRSDSRLKHRCFATNIEVDSPATGQLTFCHSAAQMRECVFHPS